MKEKIIMASGGFDPLHRGHIRSFLAAKALGGRLVVVIDGDDFLIEKKGAVFMPIEDRVAVIQELRCVDQVYVAKEGHIGNAIRDIKPDILVKGGDRQSLDGFHPDERSALLEVGTEVVFGVGGNEKVQSSSDILKAWANNPNRKY